MTVGEKIKEIRTQLGMSVRAFGKYVDYDFTQISRIERGNDAPTRKPPDPSLDLVAKICNATNYDLAIFLEETGYIKKKAPTIQLVEDENLRRLTAIYNALEYDLKANLLSYAENIVKVYSVSVDYNGQRKVSSN